MSARPTQERLRELFIYEPLTGRMLRKKKPQGKAPDDIVAGRTRKMRVDYGSYGEHQLVWVYHYGTWPIELDHINGNPKDNRIDNLREVDRSVNMQNLRKALITSKTGLLGAHPHRGKFQAQITVDGRIKYLGLYEDAKTAHEAYIEAKRRFHVGCTI